MKGIIFFIFLLLVTSFHCLADNQIETDLNEEIVQIPLTVEGIWTTSEIQLTGTMYRPQGTGPFALIILSHGSTKSPSARQRMGRYRLLPQIREFIHRDFAVLVPIRRGYGPTGGDFAEDYYSCSNPSYVEAGMESAKDILAAMRFAATLPYIQTDNILLVGQSGGGFASLATASLNPPGLRGVINFAGGRGGERDNPGQPCRPDKLKTAFTEFSKTIQVPVLWFYTENDQFFNPEYVRDWFRAFKEEGGKGRLVIAPPFGNNGHLLFPSREGIPLWTVEFDAFIKQSIHMQPLH